MRRILYCKACGRPLSRAVTIVRGEKLPHRGDRQPPMPDRKALELIASGRGRKKAASGASEIWMNLGDLLGEARYTPHKERLTGCCGLNGWAGPNRVCECGAHIGTEVNDCHTQAMFAPDPSFTRWEDAEEGS